MANAIAQGNAKPIDRLKLSLSADSVKEQFQNALKENSGAFIASIIDLYSSDKYLQQCDPNKVVMEALKAATLKLPINKQLGFAYIVPYKNEPQFQIGYKGYIQLAMRTGQYKYLNAGVIYEGVDVARDTLTGGITFSGDPTSDKPQGYFAHMELLNGFSKTLYMTHAEVTEHAKRYSKSFSHSSSVWKSNFDEMATKTTIRRLLSTYGIMSVDMIAALTTVDDDKADDAVDWEVQQEANQTIIDIDEVQMPPQEDEGPGF